MRNRAKKRQGGPRQARSEPAGVRPRDVERAQSMLADKSTYLRLGTIFGAIADPTRAAIVHILLAQELCTTDLALVVGISTPSASQHLRVLRDLRLVAARRVGRLVLYRLADAHVAELVNLGVAHEAES